MLFPSLGWRPPKTLSRRLGLMEAKLFDLLEIDKTLMFFIQTKHKKVGVDVLLITVGYINKPKKYDISGLFQFI